LGWKPYDYYTASPYEFFAECEGYCDKQDREERRAREIAYMIYAVNSEKGKRVSKKDFWPIFGDKEDADIPSLASTSKEMLEHIKRAHGLK